MAASAGFRMASNRSVKVIAASTRFRMASKRVLRPWRPTTRLLRSKRRQTCQLGVGVDFYMSSRVRTIQNIFPKAVMNPVTDQKMAVHNRLQANLSVVSGPGHAKKQTIN
jgi:hypothetical protein